MAIRLSRGIVADLIAAGFIPTECRAVTLDIPADGLMVLHFEVFMTDDRLKQLGGAFLALAAERDKLAD